MNKAKRGQKRKKRIKRKKEKERREGGSAEGGREGRFVAMRILGGQQGIQVSHRDIACSSRLFPYLLLFLFFYFFIFFFRWFIFSFSWWSEIWRRGEGRLTWRWIDIRKGWSWVLFTWAVRKKEIILWSLEGAHGHGCHRSRSHPSPFSPSPNTVVDADDIRSNHSSIFPSPHPLAFLPLL